MQNNLFFFMFLLCNYAKQCSLFSFLILTFSKFFDHFVHLSPVLHSFYQMPEVVVFMFLRYVKAN